MLITKIYIAAFCILAAAGFLFRKNENHTISKTTDMIFCVAAAVIASTFFSTFPLTKTYTYTDSSVFIYIGKMMREGYVPYADLFDHKGILLYFIQYLGVLLSPDSLTGIWFLEVLNMIATSWLIFQIAGLFTEDRMVKYISVIAVVVMCGMNTFEGGNFTEEYALPWISLALYIFLKYFQNFEYRFKDIVWLGAGFAVIALLRVNMAAVWVAVMPIILIRMIWKRQWKQLGNCALGFVIGMGIVCIPVMIYLLCTGSLEEFIECYIIFNFGYSDGGSNWAGVLSAIGKGVGNLPLAIAAFVISFWPNIKNRLYILNGWALLATLYFSHMSGRYYQHYGMILLPMLIVLFVGAFSNLYDLFSCKEKIKLKLKFPGNWVLSGVFVLAIAAGIMLQYKWANLIRESMMQTGGVAALTEYIQENSTEEDDVLIVGNDSKYYLLTNRSTKNKYFYQTPPIKINDEIYEEFMDELERCQSDLVAVMGNKEECLAREDNLGKVYQYFEEKLLNGEYQCQIFENFYVYTKVEKE